MFLYRKFDSNIAVIIIGFSWTQFNLKQVKRLMSVRSVCYPLRLLLISIMVRLVLRVFRGAWTSPLSSLRVEAFGRLSGAKDSRHFWNPQIKSKARTRYSKQTNARATSIGAAGSSCVQLVPACFATSSECQINRVSVCLEITSLRVKTLGSHVFTSVLMTLVCIFTALQSFSFSAGESSGTDHGTGYKGLSNDCLPTVFNLVMK